MQGQKTLLFFSIGIHCQNLKLKILRVKFLGKRIGVSGPTNPHMALFHHSTVGTNEEFTFRLLPTVILWCVCMLHYQALLHFWCVL